MARARTASRLIAAMLACTACHSRRIVDVDLSSETGIAFFAIASAAGELARVTAPFALDEGVPRFGTIPALTFEEGEVLLVRFDERELPRGTRFDLLASNLQVELAPPPDRPAIRTATAANLRAWEGALPLAATISDAARTPLATLEDDPRIALIRANVTLRVPIEIEHCRAPGSRELTHYGDLNPPNAPCPFGLQGTFEVIRDGDHALMVSSESLAWIGRGESISTCHGQSGAYLSHDGLGQTGYFTAATIDRSITPHRFLAASSNADRDSILYDVAVVDGRLTITSSLTVTGVQIDDLAYSENGDGRIAIAGDTTEDPPRGIVMFVERINGRPTIAERHYQRWGQPLHDEKALIISVADYWILLRPGTTYRYRNGIWSESPIDVGVNYFDLAARVRPTGELEVWVSGVKGELFFQLEEGLPWRTFKYERASSFLECAVDADGYVFDRRIRDLELDGSHLFVAIQYCRAIAQIELFDDGPDETCVAYLPAGDRTERFGDRESMLAIALDDGEMIVASEDSKLRSATILSRP